MSNSPLLTYWRKAEEKVDSLKARERLLVLLMALAVVYMVWDIVIYDPLFVKKKSFDAQFKTTEQKIAAMEIEEKAILSAVNADPDRDLKEKIASMQNNLDGLNQSLEELSVGLIPVEELAGILHDVLERTGNLQLQSLRTLPVEEVKLSSAQTNATNEEEPLDTGVFKHSVELKVKGNFREFLRYLDALETMNWRFYWDELSFEENDYPEAIITLHVHTLSTEEGLFGV